MPSRCDSMDVYRCLTAATHHSRSDVVDHGALADRKRSRDRRAGGPPSAVPSARAFQGENHEEVADDETHRDHGSCREGLPQLQRPVPERSADGAAEIVDPRPYAEGTLGEAFERYDVGRVLPAKGYSVEQRHELQRAIDAAPADLVVIATPIDLRRVVKIEKPCVRVTYRLEELAGEPPPRSIVEPAIRAARRQQTGR